MIIKKTKKESVGAKINTNSLIKITKIKLTSLNFKPFHPNIKKVYQIFLSKNAILILLKTYNKFKANNQIFLTLIPFKKIKTKLNLKMSKLIKYFFLIFTS